jgi:hypothetical protein
MKRKVTEDLSVGQQQPLKLLKSSDYSFLLWKNTKNSEEEALRIDFFNSSLENGSGDVCLFRISGIGESEGWEVKSDAILSALRNKMCSGPCKFVLQAYMFLKAMCAVCCRKPDIHWFLATELSSENLVDPNAYFRSLLKYNILENHKIQEKTFIPEVEYIKMWTCIFNNVDDTDTYETFNTYSILCGLINDDEFQKILI